MAEIGLAIPQVGVFICNTGIRKVMPDGKSGGLLNPIQTTNEVQLMQQIGAWERQ